MPVVYIAAALILEIELDAHRQIALERRILELLFCLDDVGLLHGAAVLAHVDDMAAAPVDVVRALRVS